MAVKLSAFMNDAQFSSNGLLLSGGKIETYLAGSSTPATTYTSSAGNVAQANPIILNTRGEVDNLIWLTTGIAYKFILKDSLNNVIRTLDNVTGVNDIVGTTDQWVTGALSPTFVAATQFTLAGDQTTIFEVGRRLKLTVTSGTVYGTIASSVFTTLTTVTLTMDTGQVLDSGLSAVSYGILSASNNSIPFNLSAQSIQAQTYTAFTTGGTSAAYILTPSPALTALATNQRFNMTLNAAPTGSPTLAVSGLLAKSLKYYDINGAKQFITAAVAPINWNSDIIYDGTDWVMKSIVQITQNAPVFSAKNSVSQAVTSGVATKVTLGTETYDTNNNFATSRFTPTVAGYYQINGILRGNATSLTQVSIILYVNGVEFRRGGLINVAAATVGEIVTVGDVIFFNGTTDYVELFGVVAGSAPEFDFVSATHCCQFSGCFLRT